MDALPTCEHEGCDEPGVRYVIVGEDFATHGTHWYCLPHFMQLWNESDIDVTWRQHE